MSLKNIVSKYEKAFSGSEKTLGEYPIKLIDEVRRIFHPPGIVPLSLQPRMKDVLRKLELKGVIERVEYPTDWVNSQVIVEKKNGDRRLCLEPKDLNRTIKRGHYIIPVAEDAPSKLNAKKIFSVIDI